MTASDNGLPSFWFSRLFSPQILLFAYKRVIANNILSYIYGYSVGAVDECIGAPPLHCYGPRLAYHASTSRWREERVVTGFAGAVAIIGSSRSALDAERRRSGPTFWPGRSAHGGPHSSRLYPKRHVSLARLEVSSM